MARLIALFPVLTLTLGILTGCQSIVTTYDRIRATLTEPEPDETIHRYGAWFVASSIQRTESADKTDPVRFHRPNPFHLHKSLSPLTVCR
jgi:hypothetical protein